MSGETPQISNTENEDSVIQEHIKEALEEYYRDQQMLQASNELITRNEDKSFAKKRNSIPKAGDYLKNYIFSKKTSEQLQQVNRSVFEEVRALLFKIAEEVIEEDGGFLPGFSLRVRAYTLDDYYEQTGFRKSEHILAVDKAMREFSRQRKNLDTY